MSNEKTVEPVFTKVNLKQEEYERRIREEHQNFLFQTKGKSSFPLEYNLSHYLGALSHLAREMQKECGIKNFTIPLQDIQVAERFSYNKEFLFQQFPKNINISFDISGSNIEVGEKALVCKIKEISTKEMPVKVPEKATVALEPKKTVEPVVYKAVPKQPTTLKSVPRKEPVVEQKQNPNPKLVTQTSDETPAFQKKKKSKNTTMSLAEFNAKFVQPKTENPEKPVPKFSNNPKNQRRQRDFYAPKIPAVPAKKEVIHNIAETKKPKPVTQKIPPKTSFMNRNSYSTLGECRE